MPLNTGVELAALVRTVRFNGVPAVIPRGSMVNQPNLAARPMSAEDMPVKEQLSLQRATISMRVSKTVGGRGELMTSSPYARPPFVVVITDSIEWVPLATR